MSWSTHSSITCSTVISTPGGSINKACAVDPCLNIFLPSVAAEFLRKMNNGNLRVFYNNPVEINMGIDVYFKEFLYNNHLEKFISVPDSLSQYSYLEEKSMNI